MGNETDVDQLSRVMLGEFKRVHKRFDEVDSRLANMDERLTNIEAALRDIHHRLDELEQEARNFSGYAKEIDHLLARVIKIEKHLGLQANIKA